LNRVKTGAICDEGLAAGFALNRQGRVVSAVDWGRDFEIDIEIKWIHFCSSVAVEHGHEWLSVYHHLIGDARVKNSKFRQFVN
jgi:hypothetical protein